MNVPFAAVVSDQTLWYVTRGTGTMALILLTCTLVLGIANVRRYSSPRIPRFVIDSVHRTVALLAVVFLAIHIVTAVIDPYAPIGWLDAVVPLHSSYHPLSLGLGAVAFDLMLAVVITSLLRERVGHRVWRTVHWATYLCWPVAVLHMLGTGTDARTPWMLVVCGLCVIAVIGAVGVRIGSGVGVRIGTEVEG